MSSQCRWIAVVRKKISSHRRVTLCALGILMATMLIACNKQSASPKPDKPALTELAQQKIAAEKGDAEAQFKLAMRYENGDGVPKDAKQTVKWLEAAAAKGKVEAMIELGVKLNRGEGVKENKTQAIAWWTKASQTGNGEASYYVATQYGFLTFMGRYPAEVNVYSREPTPVRAKQFLQQAESEFNTKSQRYSEEVEAYKSYFRWLNTSASQGYTQAENELGILLLTGVQHPQKGELSRTPGTKESKYLFPADIKRAVLLLESAAGKGYWQSEIVLANLYQDGLSTIKPDRDVAAKWWDKVTVHADVDSASSIAQWYERPRDDEGDSHLKWREKKLSDSDANKIAAQWYMKADLLGNIFATKSLSTMYLNGKGVPKDEIRAFELMKKVAEMGDHDYEYSLGRMYVSGVGTAKDYGAAMKWLLKAANAPTDDQFSTFTGSPSAAQNALGVMYQNGMGTEEDKVIAYAWYNLAAGGGNEKAIENRASLERGLKFNEIAEAQTLSSAWAPGKPLTRTSAGDTSRREGTATSDLALAATGTGFYVSESGNILTNGHVVNSCREIRIPSQAKIARQIVVDMANDLAVLKVDIPSKDVASMSVEDDLKQGEEIIVFGFPLDGYLPSAGNITTGVVSALSGPSNNSSLIQITAPVQQGNSGGPVLNKKGQIVGVVVAKTDAIKFARLTGDIPQNVNFAISSRTVKSFLDANHIEYHRSSLVIFSKSAAELADQARLFSIKLECWK